MSEFQEIEHRFADGKTLEPHPYSQAFPMLAEVEMEKLAKDIKANGLSQPILRWRGKVLDGRNRLEACKRAGVPPVFDDFVGDDAAARAKVWSLNSERRHLTSTQLAIAWGELFPPEDMRGAKGGFRGNQHTGKAPRESLPDRPPIDPADRDRVTAVEIKPRPKKPPPKPPTISKPKGVSRQTVTRVRTVGRRSEDLYQAMKDGLVDAKPAEQIAKLDPEKQAKVIAQVRLGVKPSKALRAVGREKIRETNAAQELQGRYSLIYADPPWQYGNTGLTGNAEDQYPTMATEAICAMPIPEHATDNAVLLLWVTNPLLPDGLEVCRAWGFEYKTQYVWVKNRGTPAGFHVRSRTEMLWVCTRGKGMTIDPENLPDNVIEAPVGKHSAKPAEVYELIERLYPECKKLEMFCRKPREGWSAFGNQI